MVGGKPTTSKCSKQCCGTLRAVSGLALLRAHSRCVVVVCGGVMLASRCTYLGLKEALGVEEQGVRRAIPLWWWQGVSTGNACRACVCTLAVKLSTNSRKTPGCAQCLCALMDATLASTMRAHTQSKCHRDNVCKQSVCKRLGVMRITGEHAGKTDASRCTRGIARHETRHSKCTISSHRLSKHIPWEPPPPRRRPKSSRRHTHCAGAR